MRTIQFPVLGVTLFTMFVVGRPAVGGEADWSPETARLGLLKPGSTLMQDKVGDRKEHTLGKVQDFLLDLSTSQVLVTLVNAGQPGELIPVPARSYFYMSKAKLAIDVDKSLFKGAPRISTANPFSSLQAASLNRSFEYFKQPVPVLPPGTRCCSAASLVGTPVVSLAKEQLGVVKDVMVDLPLAQAVYLVIEPAGAGPAPGLYVVPPPLVRPEASGTVLVLQASRLTFLTGPRFQPDFYSDLAFPEMAAKLRKHYGLERLVAKAEPAATPGKSDTEITQAVLAELTHQPKMVHMKGLSVTTLQGRVTVAGLVANERQKALIRTAAAKVVGAANVQDNLQTLDKQAKL